MDQYNHQQAPVSYPASAPVIQAPPPLGYPSRDGHQAQTQNSVPADTQSRGDGFWKGCCAALCCCCVLDACF